MWQFRPSKKSDHKERRHGDEKGHSDDKEPQLVDKEPQRYIARDKINGGLPVVAPPREKVAQVCLIRQQDLTLIKDIGRGEFGTVKQGLWRRQEDDMEVVCYGWTDKQTDRQTDRQTDMFVTKQINSPRLQKCIATKCNVSDDECHPQSNLLPSHTIILSNSLE